MTTQKTWIQRRYESVRDLPAVFIDGALYTSWAALTALLGIFSGEESYKYVNPYFLFWSKTVLSTVVAGIGAVKMFRSTAYSEHQDNKKIISGTTETISKTETVSDDKKDL